MEYSKDVVIRTYRVLEPFLHFKKDDTVDLVLSLQYAKFGEVGSWKHTGTNVNKRLIVKAYETTLPYTCINDKNFLSADHTPYKLVEFLKECGVNDAESTSSSLNYDIDNAEFGLERVKDYLTEIWFYHIKKDYALHEYHKERKYK